MKHPFKISIFFNIHLLEWRHEGAESDHSGVGEKFSDLCHASDVLLAVLLREAQVLVQAGPHVVAVKTVGRNA